MADWLLLRYYQGFKISSRLIDLLMDVWRYIIQYEKIFFREIPSPIHHLAACRCWDYGQPWKRSINYFFKTTINSFDTKKKKKKKKWTMKGVARSPRNWLGDQGIIYPGFLRLDMHAREFGGQNCLRWLFGHWSDEWLIGMDPSLLHSLILLRPRVD